MLILVHVNVSGNYLPSCSGDCQPGALTVTRCYRCRPKHVSGTCCLINPYVRNRLSHPYHLNQSTFILRGIMIQELFFIFILLGRKLSRKRVCFTSSGPAIDPRVRHILSWKNNFPLSLIQEELVVSYWQKNGHLILVNCLREAYP